MAAFGGEGAGTGWQGTGKMGSGRDRGRPEGTVALLLAPPLLLWLHAPRMNEPVDAVRDDAATPARGVVRRHCTPQRRLGEPGWRYLAPVEGCLHGFSLADGDFGLDLQRYLVCCRLACELAANVVLLERALELRQRHAFDKRGAVERNLAPRAGVAPRPGSLLSFRILVRTSLAPSLGPQSLAPVFCL